MAFRSLPLPPGVPGRLYLSSMPGYYHPFPEEIAEARALGIEAVARLTSDEETARRSPEYWEAIRHGLLPWTELRFPIPDFGIPEDLGAFRRLVEEVAERLRKGGKVMLHCAAGIGRTGTFASCLLVELGAGLDEAVEAVGRAGSRAEAAEQRNLLVLYARDRKGKRGAAGS